VPISRVFGVGLFRLDVADKKTGARSGFRRFWRGLYRALIERVGGNKTVLTRLGWRMLHDGKVGPRR